MKESVKDQRFRTIRLVELAKDRDLIMERRFLVPQKHGSLDRELPTSFLLLDRMIADSERRHFAGLKSELTSCERIAQ